MSRLVKMTFLVDDDLRRQAKIKAAQTDMSMASVLRECLKRWVEEPLPAPEEQEKQTT